MVYRAALAPFTAAPRRASRVFRSSSARAPPRSASDAAAGSSNRARRRPARCRSHRPAPEPRRAAGGREAAPGRPRRCQSRLGFRLCQRQRAHQIGLVPSTTRMPRPPPPATALTSSGYPMPDARSGGHRPGSPTGHRSRARSGRPRSSSLRASALFPISSMTSGRGPMNVDPDLPADLGQIRVLGQKSVARMDSVAPGDQRRATIAGMLL